MAITYNLRKYCMINIKGCSGRDCQGLERFFYIHMPSWRGPDDDYCFTFFPIRSLNNFWWQKKVSGLGFQGTYHKVQDRTQNFKAHLCAFLADTWGTFTSNLKAKMEHFPTIVKMFTLCYYTELNVWIIGWLLICEAFYK